MWRKIGFGLLWVSALTSTNALAMTFTLMPGSSIDYELPPQDPQILANSWFWAITATCNISGKDKNSKILAEALSKSGKINNDPISAGDPPKLIIVHPAPGDTVTVSADSGAKVKLTNKGRHPILARCWV